MFGWLKRRLRNEHVRLAQETISLAREAKTYYLSQSFTDPNAEKKAELFGEIAGLALSALHSLAGEEPLPPDQANQLLGLHRQLLETSASIEKAQKESGKAFRAMLGGKD